MKLSDYKDEAALDLLAELIEPASEILSDKRIAIILKNNEAPMKAVKIAIKYHKKSVIAILAAMDGVDVSKYHCNVLTLPMKLLDILNDKELMDFFSSQGQMADESTSGFVTVNTVEKEQ